MTKRERSEHYHAAHHQGLNARKFGHSDEPSFRRAVCHGRTFAVVTVTRLLITKLVMAYADKMMARPMAATPR